VNATRVLLEIGANPLAVDSQGMSVLEQLFGLHMDDAVALEIAKVQYLRARATHVVPLIVTISS
jgi:hypothetical protein